LRFQVFGPVWNENSQVSLNLWGNNIDPSPDKMIEMIIDFIAKFPRRIISMIMAIIRKIRQIWWCLFLELNFTIQLLLCYSVQGSDCAVT
jgi:hypothetical protein